MSKLDNFKKILKKEKKNPQYQPDTLHNMPGISLKQILTFTL